MRASKCLIENFVAQLIAILLQHEPAVLDQFQFKTDSCFSGSENSALRPFHHYALLGQTKKKKLDPWASVHQRIDTFAFNRSNI